jgi:hypothetical protein
MATQGLRILIADDQHAQRVRLEKILNRQGYFRVAPVQSFKELLTLTHYTCEPFELFDVLLINMDLAKAAGIDMELFCRGNPQVRNALVYGVAHGHMSRTLPAVGGPRQIRLIDTADEYTVRRFMAHIDPSDESALASFVSSYPPRVCAAKRG